VDGDQEYQVEQVEDSRVYRNQLQYLVRWTGYDQMTWEPARDIDGLQALDVFHGKYPQKPGPLGMVLGGPRSSEGDTVTARGYRGGIKDMTGYIRSGTRKEVQEPGEGRSLI
jgi:hypothetical protein